MLGTLTLVEPQISVRKKTDRQPNGQTDGTDYIGPKKRVYRKIGIEITKPIKLERTSQGYTEKDARDHLSWRAR